MRGGLVGSVALHVVVLLLVLFGLPWLLQEPASPEHVVALNLVRLAEKSASASASALAPVPQEQASVVATRDRGESVPPPPTSPLRSAFYPPNHRAASLLPTTAKPAPNAKLPQSAAVARAAPASAERPRKSQPIDALAARLAVLSQLREITPPLPANPRRQDGSGESNVTASSANAGRALDASYSVKDFIRAQVERRWNLDRRLADTNWSVAIHIVLLRDGSVSRAEIVDESRYRLSRPYFDFALSARNAVLLSSPIALPPGEYAIARDIVIDFNPRQVIQ